MNVMNTMENTTASETHKTVDTTVNVSKKALSEAKLKAIEKMQQAKKESLELQKKLRMQIAERDKEKLDSTPIDAIENDYIWIPKNFLNEKDEKIKKIKEKKNEYKNLYKTISKQHLTHKKIKRKVDSDEDDEASDNESTKSSGILNMIRNRVFTQDSNKNTAPPVKTVSPSMHIAQQNSAFAPRYHPRSSLISGNNGTNKLNLVR